MSAPTLDRTPAAPSTSSAARRGRRPLILLVAAALLVIAAAIGSSLALANRPSRQLGVTDTPAAPAQDQPAAPVQDQGATEAQPASPGEEPGTRQPTASSPGAAGESAPVLPDGTHHAYVRKVDAARDRITVDVVQRFQDRDAVEAAVADGKPRSEAQYLSTWLRNQNPRLRTLPLAADVRVELFGTCEGRDKGRSALLDKLAANARQGGFYYTLTVSDGSVQRIQERIAGNAC